MSLEMSRYVFGLFRYVSGYVFMYLLLFFHREFMEISQMIFKHPLGC
jgi:hypothetical protein